MVLARLVSVLLMSVVVRTVMAYAFRREETNRVSIFEKMGGPLIERTSLILLLLLVVWLLSPKYLVIGGPYWQKLVIRATGLAVVAVYVMRRLQPGANQPLAARNMVVCSPDISVVAPGSVHRRFCWYRAASGVDRGFSRGVKASASPSISP